MRARLITHDRNRGFIVVAVLWVLAALATLVTIFSVYVINSATAFSVHDERLQAEGFAKAALELTAYQMTVNPQQAPTRGSFVFRIGNANVATDFVSETARIDLNAAQRELLTGLFVSLGAPRPAAENYADRIIAWRSAPSPGSADNEVSLYRAAGLLYAPRGAPFMHVGELSLVLGLPEQLVESALPYLTIYSGRPQVNIIDAAPQVLSALPGMTPERLYAILAQRDGAPQLAQRDGTPQQNAERLLASLGSAQPFATVQGSKAVRVTARILFDNGQRMTTEAVIFMLDNGTEPYRILTWRDDVDDTPAAARAVLR